MSCREACLHLLAPLLAALALPLLSAKEDPWPGAADRFQLDSGLPVLCFADGNSGNSVVQILIHGGQRLGAPGKQGLTYLTMNLALQVPERADVQRLMEMGAAHYLSVFPDYALVTIQCQSTYLEETLRIIAKHMADPLLTGLRIHAVKNHMKNLQKEEQDQPLEAMRLAQRQAFFAGSAGAGSVFGTEASLDAIGRNDISALHQALFSCSNLKLLVVSDLKADVLRGILQKTCGRFLSGPAPAAAPVSAAPASFPPQKIKLQTTQALLSSAFLLPPVRRENIAAGALLEALLGKGIDSRLWALRSRRDLAYGFDAEFTALEQGSLLSVHLKTDPARLEEARAFLDVLFADLRENGIQAPEFAAAQANAGMEFLKSGESKKQLSALAAHLEGMGLGAEYIAEFTSQLQAMPLDEFNRYLKRVLQSANRFDAVVGPGSDGIPFPENSRSVCCNSVGFPIKSQPGQN
jgi:zinc protease